MTRPIPQAAVDFVKQHEALRLQAYQDVGGVWTVGYGHAYVPAGETITQAQADAFLMQDLQTAAQRLETKIKPAIVAELTDNQWSALLDFAFNMGVPGTGIWLDLNAGNFDQVATKDFPSFVYVHINGQPVKVSGLVNRRADEVRLWSTDEPGSTQAVVSSAVTRSYATPAAPSEAKPRGGIGPAIATAATGIAAAAGQAGDVVKNIANAVSPYADASDHVKALIGTLAMASAGLAVVTLGLVYLRNRAVSQWGKTTMPSLPPNALPPAVQGTPKA